MTITHTPEQRATDSPTPETEPVGPVDQPDPVDQPIPGPREPAELVHVDPRTLVIDTNVRGEAALDKPFIGSIKDLGVLVPISARRIVDGDGEELRVILGQRRTRAAVEAGLALVPVFVVDAPSDEKAAQIARIIEQVVENDQRAALPDTDRVAAHQQLSLLGLSAGQIARRTRTGVRTVKTSLAVAGSELATAAMHRYTLTLDQAAVIAEFDGDTEAIDTLTVAAKQQPAQFEHVAQRLRDARIAATARAYLADELTASGVSILEQPDYADRTTPIRRLSLLKAGDAGDGTEMGVEEHAGCPGHAAYLHENRPWDGPVTYEPVYVCSDWKTHGHADRYPDSYSRSGASGGRVSGSMSEQQKTERREVIANNKDWASAQTVRRGWLGTFLARRTPPKDAPQWIAATLASGTHEIRRAMEGGHPLACQLLNVKADGWSAWGGGRHPVEELAAAATPARAGMLTLGLMVAGIESTLDRHSWRSPNRTTRSYLTALERWGYPLSDVERLAATDPHLIEQSSQDASDHSGAESGDHDVAGADGGGSDDSDSEDKSGGSDDEENHDEVSEEASVEVSGADTSKVEVKGPGLDGHIELSDSLEQPQPDQQVA